MICGVGDPSLPDAGDGVCCAGAALYGPERCTCWRSLYDREQVDPVPVPGPPQVRDGMCGDCAYRPGSPEKEDHPDYRGDADQLERLAASGTPFWCHDGLRRELLRRHPSGVEHPSLPGAYDPPMRDGVPYRADGRPGLLCAGWDARRRALGGAVADEYRRTLVQPAPPC